MVYIQKMTDTERNIEDAVTSTDEEGHRVKLRKKKSSRLILYIVLFILIENLIIPPRYQVSNNIALAGIWVYQHTASPVFKKSGAVKCRFYPTCSEYGRLSLFHYGFLRGSWMAVYRIFRCHPFNRGPHEDWPYEGAWEDTDKLPNEYLNLPDDVNLPHREG